MSVTSELFTVRGHGNLSQLRLPPKTPVTIRVPLPPTFRLTSLRLDGAPNDYKHPANLSGGHP